MIFLLIVAFACIILYEVPGLIRNKYYRELIVFSVLIFFALTISVLQTLKIELPNPVRETQYYVRDLIHLSYE